ncbi:hypothetical protein B7486_48960 [cyanobacterium TDX16]|nr:hypothetical protein B7486_48960 [cyanobacterium TDX16]
MLYYLVTRQHRHPIKDYLRHWGSHLVPHINVLIYEELNQLRSLPLGTYIFSDIERLTPEQTEMGSRAWEKLSSGGKSVCLLNHPTGSMRRYQLLRTLSERGLNQFNVYRLTELAQLPRFPIFLRAENDHDGNQTPLLKSLGELDNAIAVFKQQGKSLEDKIITEFCDTSDQSGIFRKYSAFLIGQRIIPRSIYFSQHWMLKSRTNDLTNEQTRWEEQQYIETNPHEAQLREIFRLANIQYGRIDYSLLNGVPQVWEINTNPGALRIHPTERLERVSGVSISEFFSAQFELAFQAIDYQLQAKPVIANWTAPKIPLIRQNLQGQTRQSLLILDYIFSWLPPGVQIKVLRKFKVCKNGSVTN